MNPYVEDILDQPAALERLMNAFDPAPLAALSARLHGGEFDRLVITGMGASYNAAYPALLELNHLPIPVQLINTAELLHYQPRLISPRSLVWMVSQSGRSAEIVRLLEWAHVRKPAYLLSCTNDADSPLALSADLDVPILAGPEATVSIKTYANMTAAMLLCAEILRRGEPGGLASDLARGAQAVQAYLQHWQSELDRLEQVTEIVERMTVIGRGPSLAALWNGTLILKEAAKTAFEGLHAAEFRHGPLELAEPGFTALVLAGPSKTRGLNLELAREIHGHGGKVFWLDDRPQDNFIPLLIPSVPEPALPLVEILPFQLLTLIYARRKGYKAGHFRYLAKVTTKE